MELQASSLLTRRRIAAAIAIAAFTAHRFAWAGESQTMQQIPSSPANEALTSLHQEIEFKAAPARIYQILLSSKEFAAFTSMPAEIAASEGGPFSMFGGMIVGRTIELVSNQRIVQAWRRANWDQGIYSLVKFELKPRAAGTIVILDHSSFPAGDYDHLFSGWGERYWDPLHKYLA